MKKQKITSPIEVLIVVCNRGVGNNVSQLLEANHVPHSLIFNGEGTMVPDISSLFGFGITEREVVACFIKTELSDVLVETIYNDIKLDLAETGLVFTLGLSSASKQLLNSLQVNLEV